MVKYGRGHLHYDKMVMLLHGWLARKHYTHWFTKKRTVHTFRKWTRATRCKGDSLNIKVCKILWDKGNKWGLRDDVLCETTDFDLYHAKDLDNLVGYLFQASIEGYTIRHVSTETLTGIYLERSRDGSTNIDDEVIGTLVEVAHEMLEDMED